VAELLGELGPADAKPREDARHHFHGRVSLAAFDIAQVVGCHLSTLRGFFDGEALLLAESPEHGTEGRVRIEACHAPRYGIGVLASTNYQGVTREELPMKKLNEQNTSPMRLLEMLVDRFGIFEAAASATITLARLDVEGETDLPMQGQVAEAVLEFGDDLRAAFSASREWAQTQVPMPLASSADEA
jgi:hypothetical protein